MTIRPKPSSPGPFLATLLGLLIPLALAPEAPGQGLPADYERAEQLREKTQGKVFRDRVVPRWFGRNDRFWYRVDLEDGKREFWLVDAVKGEKTPAFDASKLAEALGKTLNQPVDPLRLPIDFIELADDVASVRVKVSGKDQSFRFDPVDHSLTATPTDPAMVEPTEPPAPNRRGTGGFRPRTTSPRGEVSPDKRWAAYVDDHNLKLRDQESREVFSLSTDGTDKDEFEGGVFWSPDSSKLVAYRTAKGGDRRVTLVESSPRAQLQPKVSTYFYLKPGDDVPVTKPHLFDVATRKEVAVADDLFKTPYELDQVRWAPDSSRFTFFYNQRGHQVVRVIAVDAKSGEPKALIEESFPTFVDYSNKTFLHYLDKTNEILWMSERSGWNHLYLVDASTGSIKNKVTQGEWLIRSVDRVDDDDRAVWLQVMGFDPKEDPYHAHNIRVGFDGSNLTRLTEGDGNHRIRYSPDRRFLLDTYSRVDQPPVTELRRVSDGKLVVEVERADASSIDASGVKMPERFVAKGRDGKTDIHGIIIRPTNYDPNRKYPVIEAIYAGPQGAFVPKDYRALPGHQALAELGFIVVQIDGMGTNWRSKAFHDVCSRNLADAGFPDRILWMKAAAQKDPAMDLGRVGIFGGSAGGQNALGAMLFHGDFYKAAAADCGCHDNRMDKIWWNEAWMGWPIGAHYAEQSNVTNAHKLTGALLLTVGEVDHNVDPSSTMQVVNALIRANKDFDLIVFPGADHGAGGSPYGDRRRRDFFVKHLIGVEPPRRNLATSKAPTVEPRSLAEADAESAFASGAFAASSSEEADQAP